MADDQEGYVRVKRSELREIQAELDRLRNLIELQARRPSSAAPQSS